MVSDERALATWLAGRDDRELAEIFGARGIPASAPWRDFFDAAEALLDPVSVDRALTRLTRGELIGLAHGADGQHPPADSPPVPVRMALISEDGRPWAPVAAAVRRRREEHPAAFVGSAALAAPRPAPEEETLAVAERVLATVGSLADVLVAAMQTPLSRITSGGVSAADRRRLIDAGALAVPEEIDDLVGAAAAAGLVASAGRDWEVTEAGEAWLRASTVDRWTHVVRGFRDALPFGVRSHDGGYLPVTSWPERYPLDAEWPQQAQALTRTAMQWGLVTPTGREPEWATLLRTGGKPDAEALARHLPAEIDRVYLQADLTAIAPGPLAPALDLRLRRIAERESRAQASTYRFTAESLTVGLTDGESAESIRDFLTGLSLTGLPQPLAYLIDSTAARHGRIRVRSDPGSRRTVVESDDAALLDAVSVDQALRPLGLVSDGGVLVTGVSQESVTWALADARYPVVPVDERGEPITLRRRARADDPGRAEQRAPYATLLATLRGAHGDDAEGAWLEREIVQAVRHRSVIDVVVRMPDGAERTFTLEATGFGGGRLRGRDQSSDVERTLPLSHVVTVRTAG